MAADVPFCRALPTFLVCSTQPGPRRGKPGDILMMHCQGGSQTDLFWLKMGKYAASLPECQHVAPSGGRLGVVINMSGENTNGNGFYQFLGLGRYNVNGEPKNHDKKLFAHGDYGAMFCLCTHY